MPNLRSRAEALALGLEIGSTSIEEVVAWADTVIATEAQPHWSVCELATMTGGSRLDVAKALRDVPGELDQTWVRHEIIRQLTRMLTRDRAQAETVAKMLFHLAMRDEELPSVAWWAWDDLLLANDGVVGTRDKVVDEMIAELQAFGTRCPEHA